MGLGQEVDVYPGVRGPLTLRHADRLQPQGQQHLCQCFTRQNRQGLLDYLAGPDCLHCLGIFPFLCGSCSLNAHKRIHFKNVNIVSGALQSPLDSTHFTQTNCIHTLIMIPTKIFIS